MEKSAWIRRATALLLAGVLGAAQAAEPMPALSIDRSQTTVSGLSSGGFMAVQLHVAFSGTFGKGAGVVAGGPYFCAENTFMQAIGRCMKHATAIPVNSLVGTVERWDSQARIDPLANLKASKVYLFSGSADTTVRPGVVADLRTFYRRFVPDANIVWKNDIAAEHAMVTDDYGARCGVHGSPFINNCGFDLAGAILKHLYGPLEPRNAGEPLGRLIEVDQRPYVRGHGVAESGWLYLPRDCNGPGANCRLHVALHGCRQNQAAVGEQWVRYAGYNRWADSNQIVVFYPQTGPDAVNACWDWWGYDSLHYATGAAPQMSAIKAMVDALSGGPAAPGTPGGPAGAPTGLSATTISDSSVVIAWEPVRGARGYNVYRDGGGPLNQQPRLGTRFTDTGLNDGASHRWTVTAIDAQDRESEPSLAVYAGTAGGATDCNRTRASPHAREGRVTPQLGIAFPGATGEAPAGPTVRPSTETTTRRNQPGHHVPAAGC